jgi:hypothetical protein
MAEEQITVTPPTVRSAAGPWVDPRAPWRSLLTIRQRDGAYGTGMRGEEFDTQV